MTQANVEYRLAPPPRGKGAPVPDPEGETIEDDRAEVPDSGDARDDEEKMKRNRERLNVNERHKTPDMEKGHRGTFP
jgi:hypothetical protein